MTKAEQDAFVVDLIPIVAKIARAVPKLPSDVDVDDLVSEGVVAVLRGLKDYREDGGSTRKQYCLRRACGAVYDTLRRSAYSDGRRKRHYDFFSIDDVGGEALVPATARDEVEAYVLREEKAGLVRQVIEAQTPRRRDLLHSLFGQDMLAAEYARRNHISEASVSHLRSNTLKSLAELPAIQEARRF